VSTVGVIVNPHAGKDIRRLVSAAGQTSDAVKIGIVRRVVVGALEQGAERVIVSSDTHHLAERAVEGLDGTIEFADSPFTGSHLDTIAAARSMWKGDVGAIVVLGGDGTCRDVSTGWPGAPMIAISTGTNNVFPSALDATGAGVAASAIASGAVALDDVSYEAKRVTLRIDDPRRDAVVDETALVEAALVDAAFVGARAISDPTTIRWVVAAIADPASTGVSSIAGRVEPVDRRESCGLVLHLGPGGRPVRVPLTPGSFGTVEVRSADRLDPAEPVTLPGGGVLAFDGERTLPVSPDATITASIDTSGPRLIDVGATLVRAATARLFDAPSRKDGHGD
jgi:predicted polyphosphate/ATP-dependent NAD kinase